MKDYYLGIDAGTESCGIAATDTEYNLLRFKGKDMWGVNLFDQANDSKTRRSFRGMRRRIKRRQQRIDLLQDLFASEMSVIDKNFFIRLNNSSLLLNDKVDEAKSEYTLFNDNCFTDVDFYKKYPTIFHLRFALSRDDKTEKFDLRTYYLALHHIVKYRGHFLFEGQNIEQIGDPTPFFAAINGFIEDNFGSDCRVTFDLSKAGELKDKLLSGVWSKKDGAKFLETLFGLSDKQGKEFAKALAGAKFKTSVLFDNESYEDFETPSYSFADGTEETFENFIALYGDDAELLKALKGVYDWSVLMRMLKGKASVSEAMIELYDKHAADLRKLKDLARRRLSKADYDSIFRNVDEKLKNYCAYAGICKINAKKKYVKRASKTEFYDFIKKLFKDKSSKLSDDPAYKEILDDIEKGEFLPRILDADSGVFPYQINGYELKKICDNLKKDYPEFATPDAGGFSIADKIEKIFLFRIPYYVGPLSYNPEVKSNAWIEKRLDERVLPWNFEKVVDVDATAEKFIRRMTNKCSFLKGADVLPKQSLLYSRYTALNQLNKLTVNSVPISVELKQRIFNELFLKDKKPTVKKLTKLLVNWGLAQKNEEIAFGGIDLEFTTNMSSYVTVSGVFAGCVDEYEDVIEDIILCHTLFTNKNDVEKRILAKYGDLAIVRDNIKVIKGWSFKDFGKLSKELLTGLYASDETGDGELPVTIMDLLWCTNMNLMEIVNDKKYEFAEKIKRHNGEESEIVTYDDLDEYYLNAMTKRGVWRALNMIDEYVKAIGNPPKKFFIEVTRGEEKEKQRKDSRLTELKKLYAANKKLIKDYDSLIAELNGKTEAALRQERLYLYFKQLGRCMYSGKKIDLEDLSTDLYDVDHIIPQSLKKDDSIHNNKVLVLRTYNKTKTDKYPLYREWQENNKSFWKLLKEAELISAEKYARLMRKDELTEDELNDFINRQLVITSQSTKAIAEILQRKYPDSKVVYSKANNVSEFRQKFDLLKNREVNDLHHARDAYLNIVVGNVFDVRFNRGRTTEKLYYIDENGVKQKYSLLRIYNRDIPGAWIKGETIVKVKNVYYKNSMTVVKRPFETRGALYNQTVYPKGEGIIPLKLSGPMSDISKYGGYKTSGTAYFMLVESLDKKDNVIRTIEAMSVYYDALTKLGKCTVESYLTDIIGLKSPRVVFPKIKTKSLLEWNGTLVYITGATGNRILLSNANQWFVGKDTSDYLRIVDKAMEKRAFFADNENDEEAVIATSRDGKRRDAISKQLNEKIYYELILQLSNKLYAGIGTFGLIRRYLVEGKEKFLALGVFDQCYVLKQVVRFLQCKGFPADLRLIGFAAICGKIVCANNVTDVDLKLINRSIAGLYENTVVLNKPKK